MIEVIKVRQDDGTGTVQSVQSSCPSSPSYTSCTLCTTLRAGRVRDGPDGDGRGTAPQRVCYTSDPGSALRHAFPFGDDGVTYDCSIPLCMTLRRYRYVRLFCMSVCMYGCMYVWLYVCMDVWLYRCTNGCMLPSETALWTHLVPVRRPRRSPSYHAHRRPTDEEGAKPGRSLGSQPFSRHPRRGSCAGAAKRPGRRRDSGYID